MILLWPCTCGRMGQGTPARFNDILDFCKHCRGAPGQGEAAEGEVEMSRLGPSIVVWEKRKLGLPAWAH